MGALDSSLCSPGRDPRVPLQHLGPAVAGELRSGQPWLTVRLLALGENETAFGLAARLQIVGITPKSCFAS
jgi:hypothetical protein